LKADLNVDQPQFRALDMGQLLELGRKRDFFNVSLQAAILGLFFTLAISAIANEPPRSASQSPNAAVTEIPPFVGTHSETWEEFPVRKFGSEEISILGGTGVISGELLETASSQKFLLCTFYARPTDGKILLGSDAANAGMKISFSQPVSVFGAYWENFPGTPEICGNIASDTLFRFTDAAGKPAGEASYSPGHGGPTWHGFTFTTPVKTVQVSGSYVLTDGMQTTETTTESVPNSLSNISTRLRVETGEKVPIGGFIVTGNGAKNIALRGIGPSLTTSGINDVLADPTLELRDAKGALLARNDNWQDNSAQASQLSSLGLAPKHPNESGIVATLQPGTSYTVILAGKDNGTGTGLVEVYDINQAATSQLANISTRGFVQTSVNVMIGGFILGGGNGANFIALRGLGPSLSQSGLSGVLADPNLELRDSNGALLAANDDWQDDPASAGELMTHGLALQNPLESGIFVSLPAGAFTAIIAGKNGGTGMGLVEIYNVP
jgi:hypothetical protein